MPKNTYFCLANPELIPEAILYKIEALFVIDIY